MNPVNGSAVPVSRLGMLRMLIENGGIIEA
jgi:hypothetical protein